VGLLKKADVASERPIIVDLGNDPCVLPFSSHQKPTFGSESLFFITGLLQQRMALTANTVMVLQVV